MSSLVEQRCQGRRTESKLFQRESEEVPQWQGLLRSSQFPQLVTLSPLVEVLGGGHCRGRGGGRSVVRVLHEHGQ